MGRELRIGALGAHFGRNLARTMRRVPEIIRHARELDLDLLVLPCGALGGYLTNMRHPGADAEPVPVRVDGPEIRAIQGLLGPLVICLGFAEQADDSGLPFNSAVCLSADAILGVHRKVHQPLGESLAYRSGHSFTAFDTPVGRMGMLIDYDKTFPEAARSLAVQGAQIIVCPSAWPASITNRADQLRNDRQSRLFDLYDAARAAENQVFVVTSNQTGMDGGLRFLGQAKIVGPGGDVLARTWAKGGMAVARADVTAEIERARRSLNHLGERRPDAYATDAFIGSPSRRDQSET